MPRKAAYPITEPVTEGRILMRSRPIWLSYRCVHCGRTHRLDPSKLGVVVTADCGRGPVAIEIDVPGAH